MASIIIKLTKDDISTSKLGKNIIVRTNSFIDVIFEPDALEELIDDYNKFIKGTLDEQ